ncbi:hypothetical protein CU669_15015 [Paramagnetospirillum kuznetsovii]|uniref:Phage ABA sandwich domain-containing protein n=1 Tax=Paramagnetospirillum kuznetsovii TaxID=2053833 RepID=A0A364NVY8_9PROT|nr:hypothetical protein [Paramagnetospirillum kuznetsovii]RAU21065.1 hypothetical protein CU669_15015 [Paramagnetospirillum kuznetsovii]
MTNPTILRELYDRVAAAEGPDTDLDDEIYRVPVKAGADPIGWQRNVTASLDAVEALRKRFLPGWSMIVDIFTDGIYAFIWSPTNKAQSMISIGKTPTEERARLLAILAAKIAMEEG